MIQEGIPVRLYYMTSLRTLERFILPEMRIKVSTFNDVNDPFELLAIRRDEKEQRRKFSALYNRWVNSFGFISMGQDWTSPLLWGHYAESHKGVCLGIEVPSERVLPVCYAPDRLQELLDMASPDLHVDEAFFRKVATTKFADWQYEKEWRLLRFLGEMGPGTKMYYEPFSPTFQLREIIVGAKCKKKAASLASEVRGNAANVVVLKARAGFRRFEMVQQRRVTPVVVPASTR